MSLHKGNLTLSSFDTKGNDKKIKELVNSIIPLFKGKTYYQIETALKNSLDIFKSGYIIKD